MTPTDKKPETKQISLATFLAFHYGALTIRDVLKEWEELTIQDIKEQLQKAEQKLKDAGVLQ